MISTRDWGSRLEFLELRRRYLFDGEEVPGVSSILDRHPCLRIWRTPDAQRHMDRGLRSAERIAWYLRDPIAANPEEDVAVISAANFLRQFWVTPVLVEHRVYDPNQVYAGTLDLHAVEIGGIQWIVDWKDGSIAGKRYAAQLWAYAQAHFFDVHSLVDRDQLRLAVVGVKETEPAVRLVDPGEAEFWWNAAYHHQPQDDSQPQEEW